MPASLQGASRHGFPHAEVYSTLNGAGEHMPLEDYMDTTQAAAELGVSVRRIQQMIDEGQIEGAIQIPPQPRRGSWYIPQVEIERLKRKRNEQRQSKRRGRPPK